MTDGRKIVIATFGSLGDLNPYVALAHALKRDRLSPGDRHQRLLSRAGSRARVWASPPMRPDVTMWPRGSAFDIGELADRVARDDGFMFREVIFPLSAREL